MRALPFLFSKLPIMLQEAAPGVPKKQEGGTGMSWGGVEGGSWPLLYIVAGFLGATQEAI